LLLFGVASLSDLLAGVVVAAAAASYEAAYHARFLAKLTVAKAPEKRKADLCLQFEQQQQIASGFEAELSVAKRHQCCASSQS
jgi:hypothetical protein